MNICIPKERRPFEYRVGLSPAAVDILTQLGNAVFVEHDAGVGAGFSDQEYERAGARVVYSPDEAFGRADILAKFSRPMQEELQWINQGTTLMGFLFLASTRQDRVDALLKEKITAIAYEQIQLADGTFPVLSPLSRIGGLMMAQLAAPLLQNNYGGKGILLGGVAGVPPAEVVIIGGGTAGTNAARGFLSAGAHVTVLDRDVNALQRIFDKFPQIVTMVATRRNIDRACAYADVVVGAVMIPGERAPVVVTRETVKKMKPRSLIMDLSIDSGGCFETSRPTLHDRPTYIDEGVIHYCVPNVPSVVARTATHAFVNAAMPYIMEVARLGVEKAIAQNPAIETAVNTHQGELYHLQRWTSSDGD